jgi:SAM-dependent methyltransferase/uncharacterized protein YbaR (Trm112 family)
MQKQNIKAKKGEILFRSKLYEQQVEDKKIFEGEFDKDEIIEVLKSRIDKSDVQFSELKAAGVMLSPFIEIGAERCQRSMLLADKYCASGFSIDISYDSLKSADYFSHFFNFDKIPTRVCCDVYNLPFRNSSFAFAFCYETLHHFPDPAPIIKEIKRVLGVGYFFFDEEGTKQLIKLGLYKQVDVKQQKKSVIRKIFDHFFSAVTPREEEFGIIENKDIPIENWERALGIFDKRDIKLYVPKGFSCTTQERILSCNLNSSKLSDIIKRLIIHVSGGIISGLCFSKEKSTPCTDSLFDLLACPNCLEVEDVCDSKTCELECIKVCKSKATKIRNGKAIIIEEKCGLCNECMYACPLRAINKPQLFKKDRKLLCHKCGKEYPIVNDIPILFENRKEDLYSRFWQV